MILKGISIIISVMFHYKVNTLFLVHISINGGLFCSVPINISPQIDPFILLRYMANEKHPPQFGIKEFTQKFCMFSFIESYTAHKEYYSLGNTTFEVKSTQ
ncbi:hypothetical protein HHI36_002464 [Cryptolaemus montrouzieri]|uniref:Uncharacterized protein n=1 Tax=Cryptolaemus montrouzieri TaxID=559131 RepID=A0ABD2PBE1_9CUCU